MALGDTMLGRRHVLPSVCATLRQVQVEGTFPTGTFLVTVHNPVGSDDGDVRRALYGSFLPVPDADAFPLPADAEYAPRRQPGGVVVGAGRVTLNAGRRGRAPARRRFRAPAGAAGRRRPRGAAHGPRRVRSHVRLDDGRPGAARRHGAVGPGGAGPDGPGGRRMQVRRRQDAARGHGPGVGARRRRGAGPGGDQRVRRRLDGHLQGRHRRQGRRHRRHRQGRQPGRHGRRGARHGGRRGQDPDGGGGSTRTCTSSALSRPTRRWHRASRP